MSENNINNFKALIEQKRVVKKVTTGSLIAFGTPDKKAISKYSPTGILWEDLLVNLKKEIGGGSTGPDLNSWDLPNVAFVDPNYFVGDGTVGDGNKPFQSVLAANASGASIIYLKPGTHQLYVASSTTYYCAPGSIANVVGDLGVTATNVKIFGYLTVTATFGFNFTGASSDVYAEILELDGISCGWIDNNTSLHLKVKKGITTAGYNGGGYSCRQYGGTFIIETPYFYSRTTIHSPRGASPKFLLRCPDIQITDGANTPIPNTQAKTPITIIGAFITGAADIKIDLMGGTMRNLNSVASTTNVTPDSMLFNSYTQCAHPIRYEVSNGTVYCGKQYGIYADNAYNSNVSFVYKNLDVISESGALTLISSAVPTGIANFKFQDCNFEGLTQMSLGYDMNADFLRCTFKANGGATSVFSFNTASATTIPNITFKDSYFVFHTPNTTFTFTGFAPAILGILNSYSTEVLGAGAVDGWAGFTQVPTLTLPNII